MKELEIIKVEKIDDAVLQEIIGRIVEAVDPLKIILFGSWAYGKPDSGSDLDILVVVDNPKLSKRETRVKIRSVLRNLLVSKDIVVATSNDIEEWKNVPQAFVTSVMEKGKAIYEKKD
jgi:predicted nucleotidyltransferase